MTPPAQLALERPPLLHIRRMGRARDGALPVVMLHGAVTGSLASWWMTCAPSVARANPVVLYDLRGHGLSQRPATGYAMADHLDDLDRVISELGPCVLVGHSLGGWIAVEAARAWPDRVAALVGVDVPLGSRPRPQVDLTSATTASATTTTGSPADTPAGSRRRRHLLDLEETSFAADLAAEPRLDARALVSLPCPTLMVFGRRSPFADGAEIARAALGGAAVLRLEGGHALHLDATEALSEAIARFLREAVPPRPALRGSEARHG